MTYKSLLLACTLFMMSGLANAELSALDETDMADVKGQGGVYLSGELSINKPYTDGAGRWGGPLWKKPSSANPADWAADERACGPVGAKTEDCGMRIAVKLQNDANGGWYVIDNLKGAISFQGLTLQSRTINNDTGLNDSFGGDGTWFNGDVLEIGLPNKLKFKDVSFTFANSKTAEWTKALDIQSGTDSISGAPVYQQMPLFSVKIDGEVKMRGNLLVFPSTGNL